MDRKLRNYAKKPLIAILVIGLVALVGQKCWLAIKDRFDKIGSQEQQKNGSTESVQPNWPRREFPDSEFTRLCNGKDLAGWKADEGAHFAVKDGAIVIESGKGLLRTEAEYEDFELRGEFRLPVAGADSGIFFRIKDPIRYQVQIKDADDLGEIRSGKVKQGHDAVVTARQRKPAGEWQWIVVRVMRDQCWVILDGEEVTFATHLSAQSGPIGLQAEGFPVEFRNLRVRPVKYEEGPRDPFDYSFP